MRQWTKNAGGARPRLSVVVAVYNKPFELRMCLEGYRRQSALLHDSAAFELILADDGSKPDIEALFKDYAGTVPFPCTHLYQEDHGWGKPRMLNASAARAMAPYVAFTDGDCVPHRHFVRGHLESLDPAWVNCGRRVDLMETVTPMLKLEDVRSGRLDSAWFQWELILRDWVDFGWQGLHVPRAVARLLSPREPTLLGSNFSIHKDRLIEVNGFDEAFASPGIGEDTDLERRLRLSGLNFRWVTYRAIQYHLWHPLTRVGEQSRQAYEERLKLGNKDAVKGIREMIKELRVEL